MSESIVSNEKRCFVCLTTIGLHRHHIFYGTGGRQLSEDYGCWVYLCGAHHNMTNYSVHFNKDFDLKLKRLCQKKWEAVHGSREDFIKIFGRNYLYDD